MSCDAAQRAGVLDSGAKISRVTENTITCSKSATGPRPIAPPRHHKFGADFVSAARNVQRAEEHTNMIPYYTVLIVLSLIVFTTLFGTAQILYSLSVQTAANFLSMFRGNEALLAFLFVIPLAIFWSLTHRISTPRSRWLEREQRMRRRDASEEHHEARTDVGPVAGESRAELTTEGSSAEERA